MSAYAAKHLENRQKSWNEATQSRIAATTSAIEGIKSLKMMGMEDAIQSQILHVRTNEIQLSKRLRWILVANNASGRHRITFMNINFLLLTSHLKQISWEF
jgi:hypothetical protein